MSARNKSAKPLLWEKFGLYGRAGQVYDVKLFEKRLRIERQESTAQRTSLEVDVYDIAGCHLMKCKDPGDPAAYFIVFAYPRRKYFGQPKRRERHTLTFMVNRFEFFNLNLEIANRWKTAILKVNSGQTSQLGYAAAPPGRGPDLKLRQKRFLVLLNPHGGKGKALTYFTESVAPILGEADIHYNLIVTERPGHAQEIIQAVHLEEWTSILICSGDGLIFEVVNGLMKRPDWRRAIQVPLGLIPGGTGNALVASILWRSGESIKSGAFIASAAFVVTKQLVSPLDLILLETKTSRFYSFLSICYGLVADVDIESEKYRKLGVVRNVLGGLVRIFDLRNYRCRLSYLPSTNSKAELENSGPERNRRHLSDGDLGRIRSQTVASVKRSNRTDFGLESSSVPTNPSGIQIADTAFNFSMSLPSGVGAYIAERQLHSDNENPSSDDGVATSRRISISNFSNSFVGSDETDSLPYSANALQGLEPILEEGECCGETEHCGGEEAVSAVNSLSEGKRVGGELRRPEDINLNTSKLSPLDEAPPPNWVTMEIDVVSVSILNVSHLSSETIVYTGADIDDGKLFVFLIRAGISKAGLLQMLAQMDQPENLSSSPYVEIFPCKAFRLEPLIDGILTVDGEVLPCGPIQGEILPGMGRVLVGEEKLKRYMESDN